MRSKAFLSFYVSSNPSGNLSAISAAAVSVCCLFASKPHTWKVAARRILKGAALTAAVPVEEAGAASAGATGLVSNMPSYAFSTALQRAVAPAQTGAARAAVAVLPAGAAAEAAGPASVSSGGGRARTGRLETSATGAMAVASGEATAPARSSAARAAAPAPEAVGPRGAHRLPTPIGAAGFAAGLAAATRLRLRSAAGTPPASSGVLAKEPHTIAAAASPQLARTAAATRRSLGPATWQHLAGALSHLPVTRPLQPWRVSLSRFSSVSGVSSDCCTCLHHLVLPPRVQHRSRALCALKPCATDFFHLTLFRGHAPFPSSFACRVAAAAYGSVCRADVCTEGSTCSALPATALSGRLLLRCSSYRLFSATARAAVPLGTPCSTHTPVRVVSPGSAAARVASPCSCNPARQSRINCASSRRPGKSGARNLSAACGITGTQLHRAKDASGGSGVAITASSEHGATGVTSGSTAAAASDSVPAAGRGASPVSMANRKWHQGCSVVAAPQNGNKGGSLTTVPLSPSDGPTVSPVQLGCWPFLLLIVCLSMLLPGAASFSFFGLDRPFSRVFTLSVLGVYGAWSIAEASNYTALKKFLTSNFVLSIENLRQRRFHTILSASLTHASPGHLLANVFIIGQLCRLLSFQLWPSEFFSLFCLSSVMGAAGHFLMSRRPVVGASAFAYALLWTEAIKNSRELFRILPLPFLPVTALQFCQVALLFECCMALLSHRYSIKFPRRMQQLLCGVSWSGHLGGLAAGCTYSWYKRTVEGDAWRWPSFMQLNRRYALSDCWKEGMSLNLMSLNPLCKREALVSGAFSSDLRDSLKILRLECKLLTSSSELEKTVVLRVLEKLRAQKEFRRVAVAHGALLR